VSSAPGNYPLAWPAHRPRTKASSRVKGDFVADKKPITLAAASDKLEDQIERLGGRSPVLSSNIETRMDGRPRAYRAPPDDPGVCVYFELKGRPMAMACDAYTTAQQNIAAIANHIDAVRRQARYGVASAEESLQAFTALPAPSVIAVGAKSPWEVLGLKKGSSRSAIDTFYRRRATRAHPDVAGGSEAAMAELNAARDAALAETED
jgi:hypothetical protein